MKQGRDISAVFPGIVIIHQKIRGNAVDVHLHEDHELFIPLQGEIHIRALDVELKAGPGKMIYLPPEINHSFQASSSSQGERLIFLVSQKIWKVNRGGRFPSQVLCASQLCKELLFHLLLHPKTKARGPLVATLIQTMTEMLEAAAGRGGGGGDLDHLSGRTQDARIRRALDEISLHFSQNISMGTLAKTSGMSVRNFNRLFLSELELTPKQAITLFRIKSAQTLLKEGRFSVTDVALEVGYQSLSQFISTYRKITGNLPSEDL